MVPPSPALALLMLLASTAPPSKACVGARARRRHFVAFHFWRSFQLGLLRIFGRNDQI